MTKNIVVLSDGTGQEGGKGHNTNIYKIFNIIEERTNKQIAFYDRGLGTGWRKISGNIGGKGISKNICECYQFIFEQFQAGDQIFLFGFSRGAATMRSLSNFIHHFGILPQSRPELIDQAYAIYRTYDPKKSSEFEARAKNFIDQHHTMWTRIKFLGCFDTVAGLCLPFKTAGALLDGLPFFRHSFHNFVLSKSVENAYHALAIDDERKVFHPVLWDAQVMAHQKLLQVWFAGMHTDVGGGYPEQSLSDIPLVWMTQKAVENGLVIYPKHPGHPIGEDAQGMMHDSRGSRITKLYTKLRRSWDATRQDKPIIHESVLRRSQADPGYRPWILDCTHEVEPWVPYSQLNWCNRQGNRRAND